MPSFRKEQLQIWFVADNLSPGPLMLTPKTSIRDFKTGEVAAQPDASALALPPEFSGETNFTVSAKELAPWSHWDPQLYTLDVELMLEGKPVARLGPVRAACSKAKT